MDAKIPSYVLWELFSTAIHKHAIGGLTLAVLKQNLIVVSANNLVS